MALPCGTCDALTFVRLVCHAAAAAVVLFKIDVKRDYKPARLRIDVKRDYKPARLRLSC